LENGINILLPTFKNSFDRAVALVPHPSENAKALSRTLGFNPKKNSLNPSGYDGMGPYLFFHVYLTNIGLKAMMLGGWTANTLSSNLLSAFKPPSFIAFWFIQTTF
jgi:hypothetical protein